MRLFFYVSCLIGVSQLVLAALYFAVSLPFLAWQGLTPPAADLGYPLAMLAARFFVYGVGMFWIARDPHKHLFWARGMILIQLMDLAAGAAYVGMGHVAVANAALPMVNAALFAVALFVTLNRALAERKVLVV